MQSPIRIVHTADLHLGSPFRAFPEQASRLRDEQLTHFARIIDLCARQQAHLLLIAGDLFDQPKPGGQLVRTVAELLETLRDTRIFIAAGNHDPAFIDSPYRSQSWPANVYCFTDTLESIELADLPVRVHGAGFTASAVTESLLPIRPQPAAADRLNLLVLHADLVSRGQNSVYNPISLEQLSHFGMDYTALGHRHDATSLLSAGKGSVAYSGCPLGRGFDETGVKSVYQLDFSPSASTYQGGTAWACRSESVALGGRIFQELVVSIADCASHEEIVGRILAQAGSANPAGCSDNAYRVLLCGETDEAMSIVPALIQQQAARRFFHIEVVDETERRLDLVALAREISLRGTFVRLLSARLDSALRQGREDEAALARRALALGLEAFSGEVTQHAHP